MNKYLQMRNLRSRQNICLILSVFVLNAFARTQSHHDDCSLIVYFIRFAEQFVFYSNQFEYIWKYMSDMWLLYDDFSPPGPHIFSSIKIKDSPRDTQINIGNLEYSSDLYVLRHDIDFSMNENLLPLLISMRLCC